MDENTGSEMAEGRNVDGLEMDVDPGNNKRKHHEHEDEDSDDGFEPVTYKKASQRVKHVSGADSNAQNVKSSPQNKTILIESSQVNITMVDPFKVSRDLLDICGPVKFTPTANALKASVNNSQFYLLKKIHSLAGYKVTVKIAPVLVKTTKGIIHGVPLAALMADICSANELLLEAQRLEKYNPQTKEKDPMTSVILTFEGEDLPPKVTVGYRDHNVKPFIPKPVRCFKCQTFGHTAGKCSAKLVCAKCGGNHDFKDCESEISKCCHCGGSHNAGFKDCIAYKQAHEIQKISTVQKMSYAQAVKVFNSQAENTSIQKPINQAERILPLQSGTAKSVNHTSHVSRSNTPLSPEPAVTPSQSTPVLNNPTYANVVNSITPDFVAFLYTVLEYSQRDDFWLATLESRIKLITGIANKVFQAKIPYSEALKTLKNNKSHS